MGSDQATMLYLQIKHDVINAIPSLGSVFLRYSDLMVEIKLGRRKKAIKQNQDVIYHWYIL